MLRHIIGVLCVTCVLAHLDLKLPEGSSCQWNGFQGRCVSAFRCLSAVYDFARNNLPPLCTFSGRTPVICCTDCELVNHTRLYLFDKKLGILIKSGTSKAKDKCLDFIHSLDLPCKEGPYDVTWYKGTHYKKNCTVLSAKSFVASGGTSAKREQFPHMALLGYGDSIETAEWLCGGSVISERFILTAGHCLSSHRVGAVRYIALGILKRSDPQELWQKYNVKTIVRHPLYNPPSKYHDIALLETDRDIVFGSDVRPACLHADEEEDERATATGWGALGHQQGLADDLQYVRLHKFTKEQCSQKYGIHRLLKKGYDHNTQMCYGDIQDQAIPTDTCSGDSGGPLQSTYHVQCMYTIIGVTSYGRQCGKSGGAGIYTRVKSYVPWIESVVWP